MNSDRLYQGDDELWYFNVRGNMSKGPFATRAEGEDALARHVRHWRGTTLSPNPWPRILKRFGEQRRSEPRHT